MLVISPPPSWSTLDSDSQTYGVPPEQLRQLTFEESLSPEQLKCISRFFMGCKLASPRDTFVLCVAEILTSKSPPDAIKGILSRVLTIPVPQAAPIPLNKETGRYAYFPGFEGEGGGDVPSRTKFAELYNQLLREAPHSMHPAHRAALKERITGVFPEAVADLYTERLIHYHCFGVAFLRRAEFLREKGPKLASDMIDYETRWYLSKCDQFLRKDQETSLALLKQDPTAYASGDFSFHSEGAMLKKVFDAVTELNAWPIFDEDPPEGHNFATWSNPTLDQIDEKIAEDGHSGSSRSFVMAWMHRIRKNGWSYTVREFIEKTKLQLGVMDRAWAAIDTREGE